MTPTRIDIARILCPVDFSEFSTRALERAVRLANWFRRSGAGDAALLSRGPTSS